MGRLSIPRSDHNAIRRDRDGRFGVRADVRRIAGAIRTVAGRIAGDEGNGDDGYTIAEHDGTDRVRVNIYANNNTTERAEAQRAPLLQAAMQVK